MFDFKGKCASTGISFRDHYGASVRLREELLFRISVRNWSSSSFPENILRLLLLVRTFSRCSIVIAKGKVLDTVECRGDGKPVRPYGMMTA
jgi:hypothetical protein